MELVRVDTQRAYEAIRERIITLEFSPGSPIDEGSLAQELGVGLVAVREAIKLLAHDHLVDISSGGISVSEIKVKELRKLSEIRLLLESYCARQAALLATPDDLLVLETLCKEQAQVADDQPRQLFDLDHKFHQAIARAAKNHYLAEILDDFFGLSQRLWFLALPHLEFLPAAVETHLEMVIAIQQKDTERAAQIMETHIQNFYDRVFKILAEL